MNMVFKVELKAETLTKKYPYPKQTCTIFHGDLKVRAVVENKMSSGQYETTFPASEGVMDTLQSSTTN